MEQNCDKLHGICPCINESPGALKLSHQTVEISQFCENLFIILVGKTHFKETHLTVLLEEQDKITLNQKAMEDLSIHYQPST